VGCSPRCDGVRTRVGRADAGRVIRRITVSGRVCRCRSFLNVPVCTPVCLVHEWIIAALRRGQAMGGVEPLADECHEERGSGPIRGTQPPGLSGWSWSPHTGPCFNDFPAPGVGLVRREMDQYLTSSRGPVKPMEVSGCCQRPPKYRQHCARVPSVGNAVQTGIRRRVSPRRGSVHGGLS
jgi:hypothetical protein